MRWNRSYLSFMVVLLFLGLAAQPAVFGEPPDPPRSGDLPGRGRDEVPAPFRGMAELASGLLNATTNTTDTDGDGLPDNVERVLGTDWNNSDSDCDGLSDHFEVFNGMDPNNPDSNGDKMPDLFEVDNVSLDLDSDGVPNAWDWDNDGDGVMDQLDLSPFACIPVATSLALQVNTSGKPAYLTFEVRSARPDNMKLMFQRWDWPADNEGSMQDLDGSKEDVAALPMLELNCSYLPDANELEEYDITISGSCAFVPVIPVSEFGNIVAIRGRMFFPGDGVPRNISVTTRLVWSVMGKTDHMQKALQAASGKYLTCSTGGNITAQDQEVSENSTFDWMDFGGNRVAARTCDGAFLTVGPDGRLAASTNELGDGGAFDLSVRSGNVALKASNGKYLTEKANGTVYADGANVSTAQLFTIKDMGYRIESRGLAKYYEDFSITGFSAEENYGADVAVVSGTNASHIISAQLKLAYAFLRNASNELGDIPSILTEENISFDYASESCNHSDEALRAVTTRLVPEALDDLPENETLPLIIAMENRYTGVDLSQLGRGFRSLRGPLVVDLAAKEVTTGRFLRMCWYNTSENVPLDEGAIVEELRSWGPSDRSLAVLTGLALAWSNGESCVLRIGSVETDFNMPEVNVVSETVDKIITGTFDSIGILFSTFQFIATTYFYCRFDKIAPLIETMGLSKWGVFKEAYKAVEATKAGKMGMFMSVTKVLEVIGLVVAIEFALYAMIEIGKAFGWTKTGTFIAVSYFIMQVAYAITLTVIACSGPVGAVIALLIALSDLICMFATKEGWSQKLIEALLDALSDINTRSEAGVDVINTTSDVRDIDNNGLDVGDNISYKGHFYGNVTKTSDGHSDDVRDSYIRPRFTAAVPTWSKSTTSGYLTEGKTTYHEDYWYPSKKSTVYETGVSVEPGIGMVNFPVAVGLTSDYRTYYEECWWAIFWFCDRKDQTGSTSSHWSTQYFDVMPGSITDLAKWRGIPSSDWDGDGLNNSDENGTDMWKWDTDADGLGDKYERQIGTDPTAADTDIDGLADGFEHRQLTNSSARDTDEDGLSDYVEYAGWVLSFEFCGKAFDYRVNSDPRLNDTDGDGIDDYMEYFCLLNPRSRDTDGDWTDDRLSDYYLTFIDYVDTFDLPAGWSFPTISTSSYWGPTGTCALSPDGHLYVRTQIGVCKYNTDGTLEKNWTIGGWNCDIAFDDGGNIYVIAINESTYMCEIIKYDSDFNKLATYPANYTTTLVVDDKNGFIYTGGDESGAIYKYHKDNGTWITLWGTPGGAHIPFGGMDVDGEGNVLVAYPDNIPVNSSHYIIRYDPNGKNRTIIGSCGTGEGQFYFPMDVKVIPDGDLLVADGGNHRIQKVSDTGKWLASFGSKGTNNTSFDWPTSLAFDDKYIYVTDVNNQRIQKLSHRVELIRVEQAKKFADADGDGMSDENETAGWNVTVTDESSGRASFTYRVTSEPNVTDSDGDGLSDFEEFNFSSDPRSIDPDGDGLPDMEEKQLGTNLTDGDTDGDGLDDGVELNFGSDPKLVDTDREGLGDMQEQLFGSNPTMPDTDQDGLDDYNESLLGSGLTDPDSDDDFMFDSEEREKGTDPKNNDTDNDALSDGYEGLYGTEPLNNDTDGDGLEDGFEVSERLNPLSNDTDGDGVLDGEELERGLNPFSKDSDGDRVPDALDTDFELTLDDDIILVADEDSALDAFASALSKEANVVRASPQELSEKYSAEPYIVLVGRPDAPNGTAGAVIGKLLADTGGVLQDMLSSDIRHRAVRYGVWTPTQTVVMLSSIKAHDDQAVLGILKSQKVTVTENSITARYLNERPCLQLDDLDTVKATDTVVRAKLDEMALFNVTVTRYTEELFPNDRPVFLDRSSGLEPGELAMDKYLEVKLSQNIWGEAVDHIMGARLELYYTAADLDRTGDGDTDDPEDLDENTLGLYWYDEAVGNWSKLSDAMDWVNGTGVNTTDIERYGNRYEGYLWADVDHLSHFGAGGRTTVLPQAVVARAGDDIGAYAGDEVAFNGSLSSGNGPVVNFTWSVGYGNQTAKLYGDRASFVFQLPGTYAVWLTVRDSLGLTASDTLTVTVRERPGGKWILRVGPVADGNDTLLEGALVNLTIGNESFSNTTNAQGIAQFELGTDHVGKGVRLVISKEGYLPVEFATNITSGRVLQDVVPPLVIIKPGEEFNLSVGPVMDRDGKAIEGALITITIGGTTYTNTTAESGITHIVLPLTSIGKAIGVTIEKKGFRTASYSTRITSSRNLDQDPPAMEKAVTPTPSGGGLPAWMLVAAAVAILLVVASVVALLASRRKKKPARDTGPAGTAEEPGAVAATEAYGPAESEAVEEKTPLPPDAAEIAIQPEKNGRPAESGAAGTAPAAAIPAAPREAPAGFAVEDIFLMYIDGRLILHNTRRIKADMDADIMTSMLTAVQAFVKESLGMEKGTELGAMEYGDNKILLRKGKHVVLAAVIEGAEPAEFRDEMKNAISNIEGEYGPTLASWDGVASKLAGTKKFLSQLGAYKAAEAVAAEKGRSDISLKGELEFYQGFVRLKVAVKNGMETFINDASFRLVYKDAVLRLDHIEPPYPLKGDEVIMGNIEPREKKTIAFYLDPQICTESNLEGVLTYKDAKGNLETVKLPRKLAAVVCPILFTEENINTAMIKRMAAEELDKKDTKVFAIPPALAPKTAFDLAEAAVQHHDVRLVREFTEKDPYIGEAWYYGKAKGRDDKLVIRARVLGDKKVLEFFVASNSTLMLTGMLAELKADLNKELGAKRVRSEMRQVTAPEEVDAVEMVRTLLDKAAEAEHGAGETMVDR